MVGLRSFGGRGISVARLSGLLIGAGLMLPGGVSAELNDTGMTEYANETGHGVRIKPAGHPGQDARYGRDAQAVAGKLKKAGAGSKGFDFTKLDADGKPLPANAKKWDCVRDNVTGLTWEVKTTDGGLRDWRNHFSWYNPDKSTNGGGPGERNGGKCTGGIECDTLSYARAVNATKLCGHSDWRLPERWELRSLVDYGKSVNSGRHMREQFLENDTDMPTIDTDYFPHTGVKWYWSATPDVANPDYAWRVFFYDGGDSNAIKGSVNGGSSPVNVHVRLVRGER